MAEQADIAASQTEDLDKPARDEASLARKWNAEISTAERQHSKWRERGRRVEKIYNDERDLTTGRARKFNILWSNVEGGSGPPRCRARAGMGVL
jgi:hypothetical protein